MLVKMLQINWIRIAGDRLIDAGGSHSIKLLILKTVFAIADRCLAGL